MTLTISVIVMLVTYICGAITKIFIEEIPNRYIPIQNLNLNTFRRAKPPNPFVYEGLRGF